MKFFSLKTRVILSSLFSFGLLVLLFNNFSPANLSGVDKIDSSPEETRYIPGRILIQPKPGTSEEELQKIIRSHGGKQIGKNEQINLHVIELPPQASEKAVEALLKNHPLLSIAERDRYIKPTLIANDVYYANAWHLPKIGAPLAWDSTQGDGIIIAVLDSGVDPAHPDLASKLVPGYNFYDNNTNTADVYGHGTKCAGAAAAIGNNGLGVTGVSWNSKIMPIRVTGTDGYATVSGLVNGITYAADHGARVVSMSFPAYNVSSISSAAAYLKSKGGLAITAAGNYNTNDGAPNSADIIAVSGTDSNDQKASWSSYGAYVDVSAPGTSIYTTTKGGGYATASGTSIATPVTAATVALIMSANPNLKPAQIENILFTTSNDLGSAGWDMYFGHGRINAGAAVQAALNTAASDTTNPSVNITNPANGTKIAGAIQVSVNASDNASISRVELYVGSTLLATDNQAPYEFIFDSAARADGSVILMAKAFDSSGNSASHSVTVTIDNVIDTQAPVVNISSPVNGIVVKGNVTISATASDNEGVASMSLYIDGALKASSSTGSVSFAWNTRKASTGAHTIRVDAKDLSGNIGSKTIQVTK